MADTRSPSTETPLRIEVVGAFRLIVDGEDVSVTRPQVRTVLALLASATDAMSSFELEEALWPESLPTSPAAALRTVISRTRTALGPATDYLIANGGSYVLTAASDWGEVKELVAQPLTETGIGSAELRSLLDRVAGLPLTSVVDSPLVDERRTRFEQRRDRLERELVRLQVSDGDDAGAVQSALAILDRSPEDESTACLGAHALARLGRKTSGIELLQHTRGELISRGLEPSAELTAAETALLHNASDLPLERHDAEPQNVPAFVGRVDQLLQLERIAPGSALYIEGEAGIGKSSLLRAYAERSLADGVRVVIAQASASAVAPMSPIGGLIDQLLTLDGVEIAEEHRASVAMLVPDRLPNTAPPASREALISGAVDFILEAVSRTHVVLAVDDAQWLDHASILTLQTLVDSGRCRLIFMARPGHSDRVLGNPEGNVDRLTLGPLTAQESEEMVDVAIPRLDLVESSDLHRRSGGNPLFLHMLLDLLEQEIDVRGTLPPVVLAAVQRRMQALSGTATRVLQVASVIGTSFDENTIALVEPGAADGFAEAHAAGLIESGPPGSPTIFRHALVADAAYQLLGEADRIALHDQVGRVMESQGADPIEVFAHCRAAASLDAWRAGEMAIKASQQHLAAFDWEGAVATATWALTNGVNPDRHRLVIAKARGELALGIANSHLNLVEGARLAQAAGDTTALVEAVIEVCNSGSAALTGLDIELVKDLVDAALAVTDDERLLHELHAAAARAFVYSRHGAFGQQLYAETFAHFEDCDQRVQELILRNSEAGLSNPNDFGLAQRATMLLNEAADRNPELRWLARWFQYRDALVDGNGDGLAWALRDIRSSATTAERRHAFVVLGKTFDMDMQRSWAEATMALIHEDYELAEQCAEQALRVGLEQLAIRDDGFGEGWVTASYGLLLLAIRHGQGRLAELVDVVETSAPLVPAWRVAIVIANHAAGNTHRVQVELEGLVANGFAALVPDPTWTAAMSLLAAPVAEFCDPAAAVQLYDMISPFQDRMSYSGLCTFGPMHDACAVLAGALGKHELESMHRARAREQLTRLQQGSRWAFDELHLAHKSPKAAIPPP